MGVLRNYYDTKDMLNLGWRLVSKYSPVKEILTSFLRSE